MSNVEGAAENESQETEAPESVSVAEGTTNQPETAAPEELAADGDAVVGGLEEDEAAEEPNES